MRRYGWPSTQAPGTKTSGELRPARAVLYDEDGSQIAEKTFDPIALSPGDSLNITWSLIYDPVLGLVLGP